MPQATDLTVNRTSAASLIQDQNALANIDKFAIHMASGQLMTPAQFRNRPADCFMIAMQASQWGMNPLSVATQVYDVKGNLTYGSQLIIAIILQSGMVEPRPFYQAVGDWDNKGKLVNNNFEREQGLGVKVGFKFNGDTTPTYGETLFLADQITRNSPTWKTNPYQQLCYLGAKYWSRIYMPGATMGLYSESETTSLTNQQPVVERDISPNMDGSTTDVNFSTETNTEETLEELVVQAENNIAETEQPKVIEGELVDDENQSDEVPVDDNGTKLNLDIHTGTKLKDGTWRLNKNGKKLAEAEELVNKSAVDSTETKKDLPGEKESTKEIKQEASTDKYVIAIHADAIEVIGNEALIVQDTDKEGNVLVNGEWFPIEDNKNTYLVYCDEDGHFDEDDSKEDNPFSAKK